jgi:transposase-like protein
MARENVSTYFKKLLLEFITEPDPLYAMMQWLTEQLMRIESERKVGAKKHQQSERRTTYFSGYRVRRFDTRLGTLYLMVPKLRNGGYVPFFVVEKKRSEQALIQVVQEAFINGVSTRKIERLAKSLGIETLSASQVSQINKGLNEQVEQFRSRALESVYPVLWVDAMYEKIRMNGRVVSMAVLIVTGINRCGVREILAVEPMYRESEETYTALFENLKARGLEQVWLVVSDAHKGIQSAVKKCFLGSTWQRCRVHLMRNILAHVNHRDKQRVAERLKQIWYQPTKDSALRVAKMFIEEFDEEYPEAVYTLEEGLEDSMQFYAFESFAARRISSTNMQERIHKEVRRRTRVVGIFPSDDSYLRLVTCYLIEYAEDWATNRAYISERAIEEHAIKMSKAA